MIQANELRIGNKIQDNNGFIFYVASIHDDGTVYCDFKENEGDVWEFDNKNPCKGIEITEEILLKCGFEKVRSNYEEAETFDFVLGFIWFDMANQSTKLCGKYALNFIPEYLHQLQNLYFALTGYELTIKL